MSIVNSCMNSQISTDYLNINRSDDNLTHLDTGSNFNGFPTCGDDGLALTLPESYSNVKSSPYLVNLFTTHDMACYLAHVSFTDDIYTLPMSLQKLLNEAKEEVILSQSSPAYLPEHRALDRLNQVRDHLLHASCGDVSVLVEHLHKPWSDDLLEQLCGV